MLRSIFEKLDFWVGTENRSATLEGFPALKRCEFRIVGQSALLEAALNLQIAATADLDTIDNATFAIRTKLNELLRLEGMELDPLGNEIWMPEETQYVDVFIGDWVKALRALPVYVMVSKAKFAIDKNKLLIREYIAKEAPDEFFEMCDRYVINLESAL